MAQWHGVVNSVAYCLRLTDRAQWTQISRAVEPDRVNDGQPGKRLVGELQPNGPLRKFRAAVVTRLVRGNEPQFPYLGFQRMGALDRVDALGESDHLAHPAAGLAGDEVLAYPGAQVAAGADVERRALTIPEHVDPGSGRQVVGQVSFATLCVAHLGGERA